MGFRVVRLLEGKVDRQPVALGGGLQLEEEGIGTRVVAATHVLQETCKPGCTPNPAFLPVGLVPYAIAFVIHYLTVHVVNVRLFHIKFGRFIRRIRAVALAPFQIFFCTVPVHHKAEITDFTILKELNQLLVSLSCCHIVVELDCF